MNLNPLTMAQNNVVKICDMPADMEKLVIDTAYYAIDTYKTGKDIASAIKNGIAAVYNGTWHVVVGRSFGAFVTHETKHYIYFYIGQLAILAYKSG